MICRCRHGSQRSIGRVSRGKVVVAAAAAMSRRMILSSSVELAAAMGALHLRNVGVSWTLGQIALRRHGLGPE